MPRTRTSFAPGNTAALKHGARSARFQLVKQRRIGKQVRAELRQGSRAWLDRLIIAVEARLASYYEFMDRVGGPISHRGQPRKCWEMCARDESKLMNLYALREGRQSTQAQDDLAALLGGRG